MTICFVPHSFSCFVSFHCCVELFLKKVVCLVMLQFCIQAMEIQYNTISNIGAATKRKQSFHARGLP